MKKKIIIIASLMLALVLATGITVAALEATEASSDTSVDGGQSGLFSLKNDATAKKVFIKPDKSSIELSYSKTMTANEVSHDIYTDEKGDNYLFDESGRLISYIMSDEAFTNLSFEYDSRSTYIGEKQAVSIAIDHAKELFGSDFDSFEYVGTQLSSSGNIYYVEHAIKLGENDFITAATCRSQIGKDGTILTTVMKNYEEYLGFDADLLDGITKKEVKESIEKQLEELYGEKLKSFSTNTFSLELKDGAYRIKINTTAKLLCDGTGTKTVNENYYFQLR